MPELEGTLKYATLFVGGVISLAVAIGGGVLVKQFTERQAALEYSIISTEGFAGQSQHVTIFAVRIDNPGSKELEDVVCEIQFSGGTVLDNKIVGLPVGSASIIASSTSVEAKSPFLNPKEGFTIQVLFAPTTELFTIPRVDVRGRGVTASEALASRGKKPVDIGILVLSIGLGMFSVLLGAILARSRLAGIALGRQFDDQEDVLAYIYSLNGFVDEADDIIRSPRRLKYWAEADMLTQRSLVSKNPDTIRRAIKTLTDLLSYGSIAASSISIIRLDIARLAVELGESDTARQCLREAMKGGDQVIRERLRLDPKLGALASEH
jgi:hypothetical protein